MALLMLDGFDKYGPANSSNTAVAALLTAGEWTTVSTPLLVAGLSATGFAVNLSSGAVNKTLSGNYARLIGGLRFTYNNSSANSGIYFRDGASAQATIKFNSTGTVSVCNGLFGTVLGTSTASFTAGSTHYLEWDLTFNNAGSYQLWIDGVSILSGSGDTTGTANAYANAFTITTNTGGDLTVDDLYLFDTTGTTNNAVLLTGPRIETQFPSADAAVQFAVGAAILGTSVTRGSSGVSMAVNQMRLHPFTPLINMTLNSVSFLPSVTNASIQFRPVLYADSGNLPAALIVSGATSTGITSGTVKTLPLTTPQALTAGTQYWLGFMNDILLNTSLTGFDGSSTDRTVTATFASGAPGTASGTAAALSALIWGNVSVTGNNWYEVSRNPTEGAQSYVYEATVGEEDLYSFPALSAPPSAIYAVAVKGSLSKSDAGAKTASLRLKSGSTDSAGTGGTAIAPGTSFAWATSLYERDPNGNVAWTKAALDAAQAGVKVET